VLLFTSTLVLSAPTAPDTFAVACQGDILQTSVRFGESSVETFALPDQIFVFSESEATVLRAMPLRHEFENVCAIQDNGRVIEFTAEAVLVDWASSEDWEAKTTCQFAFNRSQGTASLTTRFEWSEHRNSQSEWRMSCLPTPVPVYERESR
jgi:hypothetical protein